MRVLIRRLWARHRGLTLAFLVAAVLTAFFLMRFIGAAIYWADPAHQDRPIAGWMPVRYVARSWEVPPEILGDALGLDPVPGPRRTIAEIAAQRGRSVQELAAELREAIAAYREQGQ